jgi:broad specificity phosphatase PhoE
MTRLLLLLSFLVPCLQASTQVIYIVRHAEKEAAPSNMMSDVPLSKEGKQRAEALRDLLKGENISAVYSTNTDRTKSTGEPTARHFGLGIQTYGPRPDSAFAAMVRQTDKNLLIVGHSNTVDDLVNLVLQEKKIPGDLDEKEYDNLYIIRKAGGKFIFEHRRFGPAAH